MPRDKQPDHEPDLFDKLFGDTWAGSIGGNRNRQLHGLILFPLAICTVEANS